MSGDEDEGVDVLLFEAAGFRMGTDAAHVLRVSKSPAEAAAAPGFGPIRAGARAIVAQGPSGPARSVAVDNILGVRRLPAGNLRPLPAFLRGLIHPAVIGFALMEEALIALVELSEVEGGEPR